MIANRLMAMLFFLVVSVAANNLRGEEAKKDRALYHSKKSGRYGYRYGGGYRYGRRSRGGGNYDDYAIDAFVECCGNRRLQGTATAPSPTGRSAKGGTGRSTRGGNRSGRRSYRGYYRSGGSRRSGRGYYYDYGRGYYGGYYGRGKSGRSYGGVCGDDPYFTNEINDAIYDCDWEDLMYELYD